MAWNMFKKQKPNIDVFVKKIQLDVDVSPPAFS